MFEAGGFTMKQYKTSDKLVLHICMDTNASCTHYSIQENWIRSP